MDRPPTVALIKEDAQCRTCNAQSNGSGRGKPYTDIHQSAANSERCCTHDAHRCAHDAQGNGPGRVRPYTRQLLILIDAVNTIPTSVHMMHRKPGRPSLWIRHSRPHVREEGLGGGQVPPRGPLCKRAPAWDYRTTHYYPCKCGSGILF